MLRHSCWGQPEQLLGIITERSPHIAHNLSNLDMLVNTKQFDLCHSMWSKGSYWWLWVVTKSVNWFYLWLYVYLEFIIIVKLAYFILHLMESEYCYLATVLLTCGSAFWSKWRVAQSFAKHFKSSVCFQMSLILVVHRV